MKVTKTMNDDEILYVLINVYAKNRAKTQIAEEVCCHRNQVGKLAKNNIEIKEDIIKFCEKNNLTSYSNEELRKFCRINYKSPKISTFRFSNHKIKVNQDIRNKVELYCKNHLNYCIAERDIRELAIKIIEKIAYKFDLPVLLVRKHIIETTDNFFLEGKRDETEFERRKREKEYKRTIRDYRNYNKVIKNYGEVYEIYKEQHRGTKPISYDLFFKIAREFWGNKKFEYNLKDVLQRLPKKTLKELENE